MDLTVVLILVILSAVAALVLVFVFKRKPFTKVEEATLDYTEGLNLLLLGRRESALNKFKEAVRKNSQLIDAYLKIGDILREMGEVRRAINVHKYLTVRTGLRPQQHLEILKGLTKDYQAAKEFDKALEVVNKILAKDKKNFWARELKLQLYEQKEEWDKAYQVCKELKKLKGEFKNGRLALYRVQEGLQLIEKGQEKEARSRFKDAIKIEPCVPPAYIYLADSYIREDRKGDALKVLKRFVEKVPEQSYLAFERIKELLYESGVYGEIENLYLELINNQPENLTVQLALSEIYEKKGELQKAIETCLDVLDKDPSNKTAKQYLVKFYHKAGKEREAVKLALDLINESLEKEKKFRCKNCSYVTKEPFWRCPACHEWDSFISN